MLIECMLAGNSRVVDYLILEIEHKSAMLACLDWSLSKVVPFLLLSPADAKEICEEKKSSTAQSSYFHLTDLLLKTYQRRPSDI